jgi:hypothetical protein
MILEVTIDPFFFGYLVVWLSVWLSGCFMRQLQLQMIIGGNMSWKLQEDWLQFYDPQSSVRCVKISCLNLTGIQHPAL